MPAFESGQQQQAVSPSIKDSGAFTPPVHGKTAAAEAIITKALAGNILMKELAADDRVVRLAPSPPSPPHLQPPHPKPLLKPLPLPLSGAN